MWVKKQSPVQVTGQKKLKMSAQNQPQQPKNYN